jgi:hypothetical protein
MTTYTMEDALNDVGIDGDAITETPDGLISVRRNDGAHFVVGDDGTDEDGAQWWSGTRYGADGDIEGTDSWAGLEATASAVAAWID